MIIKNNVKTFYSLFVCAYLAQMEVLKRSHKASLYMVDLGFCVPSASWPFLVEVLTKQNTTG